MNELIINTTDLFHEVTCSEGHHISAFNEGDDILTFTASKIMYCPLNADLTIYHCLTDDEYNELEYKKNEAMKDDVLHIDEIKQYTYVNNTTLL